MPITHITIACTCLPHAPLVHPLEPCPACPAARHNWQEAQPPAQPPGGQEILYGMPEPEPEPREWPGSGWCGNCGEWHDAALRVADHHQPGGRWCYGTGSDVEASGRRGEWLAGGSPCYACGADVGVGPYCAEPEPEPECEFCGGEHESDDCEERSRDLNSYSYRPEFIFHGSQGPWFGLEIEVTAGYRATQAAMETAFGRVAAVRRREGADSELVYFKEDGSVDGFEMVTMPMSFEWAMAHFPWEMLRNFRDAGCTIDRDTNGIHIHVSRSAFTPPHLYRWLKFLYRNEEKVSGIARRNSHWGAFTSEHRCHHLDHIKAAKARARYHAGDWDWDRNLPRDPTALDRYSAVNTGNEDTLEVRVFASTLRPYRARAALQLVAGSVEYTRDLSVAQIRGGAWEWPAFEAWLASQPDVYRDLLDLNAERNH